MRTFAPRSSEAVFMSTPMRRIRSGCCASSGSDHAAARPSPAMNSRRLRVPRVPLRRLGHASSPIGDGGCFGGLLSSAATIDQSRLTILGREAMLGSNCCIG